MTSPFPNPNPWDDVGQPSTWSKLAGTLTQTAEKVRQARGGPQPFRPPDWRTLFPGQPDLSRDIFPEEPEALSGRDRLRAELGRNPHKPGTRAYDDWILNLREDPRDPEYTQMLRGVQGPAFRRRELRQNPDLPPNITPQEPLTPEEFERERRFREEREARQVRPTIVGPDGEPIEVPNVVVGRSEDGTPVEGMAGDADLFYDPTTGEITRRPAAGAVPLRPGDANIAVRSGQFVWLGTTAGERGTKFGMQETASETFMLATDAVMLPYHWNPDQIAYAQEAMGMDPTGFVTQEMINGWEQIIASAAGYTMAGRKMDPFMLLDMTYDATQAARRGGGGGGGGGGIVVDRTTSQAFLNQAMMSEAGREATEEEVDQFHAILSGAGPDVDPGQLAINWIRSIAGDEAGAYQVATDYYEAMLQVLGARTQAEQPQGGGVGG